MRRKFEVVSFVSLLLQFVALVVVAFADERAPSQTVDNSASSSTTKLTASLNFQGKEISVDAGQLLAAKESKVWLEIKNETSLALEVAEITSSCKCVVGTFTRKAVLPGEVIELEIKLHPTQIVDQFVQKLTLSFSGDPIPPRDIVIRCAVKGDIEVSPRTFRFKDDAYQVINIKSHDAGVRLSNFEFMSSVLAIRQKEVVSESEVKLHVVHTASSGQAIEVLRVAYTNEKEVRHAEVKLGVSSARDYRFVPSSLLMNAQGSESTRRVFLAFSGAYCPADDEKAEISVRLSDGQLVSMPDNALSLERRNERLYEITVSTSGQVFPDDSYGVVVQVGGREFLVPFVN